MKKSKTSIKKEAIEKDTVTSSKKKTKEVDNKSNNDVNSFILSKITSFQEIIKKTIIGIQKYKGLEILGVNEINICLQSLEKISLELSEIKNTISSTYDNTLQNDFISKLQEINNELSSILKNFGTMDLEDLITICFGSDFINTIVNDNNREKFEVIKNHVHPIGYKVMVWKDTKTKDTKTKKKLSKNKIVEDHSIVELSENFDCFDLSRTSQSFLTKVYGIKIAIQHEVLKKTLIICGIVDDIPQNCINYSFTIDKCNNLIENKPDSQDFVEEDNTFTNFLNSLTMKELLVYSNDELYNKYVGIINQLELFKQKPISQIVKEFINGELYYQRTVLIQLLLKNNNQEFQYLAYLLYDLLSNDNNSNIDTSEQSILLDTLPWSIKTHFKEAMKLTIKYTNDLSEFDNNKIPLEQQICLLKCKDSIKEKAMVKLKEVKNKSEDSGTKARQYLEGLLKIPFGIYRNEPILSVLDDSNIEFTQIIKLLEDNIKTTNLFQLKEKYTNLEMTKYIQLVKNKIKNDEINFDDLIDSLKELKRKEIVDIINEINSIIKDKKIAYDDKLLHSGKKTSFMIDSIVDFHKFCFKNGILNLIENKLTYLNINKFIKYEKMNGEIDSIINKTKDVHDYIQNVSNVLDESVHGHKQAKRQIERIIGQWINGNNTGYCFGFEGPPGVGKTSLANQGISNCLKDEEGKPRPFSLIAIGGSSNGSTLEGHNYTYVGSTWGRIVDILMEKKCMNPIIFIDELDKVSKTEHGREIIGILTHLTDPSQNSEFQDKYFSGVDLDLSKVLFIFSYNDPELIDRILLDRIHRVKFNHLTLEDKLVVVKKHIIPEVTEKMGLVDNITFTDEVIEFIIEHYTYEPGVRKLKELIFEIVGEINLQILQNSSGDFEIPYEVTKDEIISKFLKERHPIKHQKIHSESTPGIINGLYANGMGKGGIISIETFFFISTALLDLKLTGQQGDVMKESMNVAKTLAWNLTTDTVKTDLMEKFEKTKNQGIHIHCPEGAVPKDGPSAGTAITTCIYSILNNKKIKKDFAITGEINLQGKVTQIGGLDLKIIGGIAAGVKNFIYPEENQIDFDKFMEKYQDKPLIKDIQFFPVDNIHQVFDMIFEK